MSTPKKVQHLLDIGIRYSELTVTEVDDPSGATDVRTWEIAANPEVRPHETTKVWIYWIPGKNGGRMHICRYAPERSRHGRNRKNTEPLTVQRAAVWLAMIAGH